MLRIVSEQRGDEYAISLHGKLAAEWVDVLEQYWRSLVQGAPTARLTVELSDVSFIAPEGERVLERIYRRGASLVATGCMNRYVVDRIRRRVGPVGTSAAETGAGQPGAGARESDVGSALRRIGGARERVHGDSGRRQRGTGTGGDGHE